MQEHGPRPTRRASRPRSRLLRGRPPDPAQLQTLRTLLVGPEQSRLDDVERVVASPDAERIGHVLPEALAHAATTRTDALSAGLRKPVVAALDDVARREPEVFGEILAPSIGTAVRRAVADTFAEVMQRLNALLERSLSVRSLRWRVIAWRSGRPYAEVVLSESFMYRVEWVVLMDSRTSLVLEQAASADSAPRAPDQITAMLSAIGTFVSDAFQPTSPGGELQSLEVGDLSVWIERTPALTIAAAIRGAAPQELRDVLRETLTDIRTTHTDALATPDLAPASFVDARPALEDCLREQRKARGKAAQWLLAIVGLAVLVTVMFFVQRSAARHRLERELVRDYAHALGTEPGIVVTSVHAGDEGVRVRGLVDPRALPPVIVLMRAGLPPAQLDLAPFTSSDPRLPDSLAVAAHALATLEGIEIAFPTGEAIVAPGSAELQRARDLVLQAQAAAERAGVALCVTLVGSTDKPGPRETNVTLRRARAEAVLEALVSAGVPRSNLTIRGDTPSDLRDARSTTFVTALRPRVADRSGCP